jgi:hypothetical protein
VAALTLFVAIQPAGRSCLAQEDATGQSTDSIADSDPLEDVRQSRQAARDALNDRLRSLAAKCEELHLTAEAIATRELIIPPISRGALLFLPSGRSPWTAPVGTDASPAVDKALREKWAARLRTLCVEHAAEIARIAQASLFDKSPAGAESRIREARGAFAYELLHEAWYFDPQNSPAGEILAHRPEAAAEPQARRARARHPTLGWNPGAYWRVSTPHFQIVANGTEAEAVDLARELELLHTVWRQVCFELWSSADELASAWQKRRMLVPKMRRPHHVVLFADREQYVAALRPVQPQIEISLGYYDDRQMVSYFFTEGPSTIPTARHEVTHQLLQEHQRPRGVIAADANFWAVEGIALYMESCAPDRERAVLGGVHAARLQYARYRALSDRFYVPLADLAQLGRTQLQQDERIQRIYSQSAGLTQFLMHGNDGRWRAGLMDYLRQIYAGIDRSESLLNLWKTSLPTLDAEYHRFLQVTDADLASLPLGTKLTKLCLTRTAITDQGLELLRAQSDVEWLDLGYTRVGDAGLANLRDWSSLKQLNLEATRVTDRTLEQLRTAAALEELDLSHTAITDEGLASIRHLPRLQLLWLTGTRITDVGLQQLTALPRLASFDATDSAATAVGIQRLQESLPGSTIDP